MRVYECTCDVCVCVFVRVLVSVQVCVCLWFLDARAEFGVPLEHHMGNLCLVLLFLKRFSPYFGAFLKRLGSRHACVNWPSTASERRRFKESQRSKCVDIKPFTRAPILVKFEGDKNAEKKKLQFLRGPCGAKKSLCRPASCSV